MAQENVVFQGFTVIPLKVEEKSKCLHYLYVKEHSIRQAHPKKPKDRTLFVLNIPPYCTEELLEALFSPCGHVEAVYLHKKPTSGLPDANESKFFPTAPIVKGYKVGYLVFKSAKSVEKAKSLPYNKPLVLRKDDGPPLITGVEKWCQEYKEDVVNTAELQAEVEDYMQKYDAKVEEDIEQAKAMEGVADDDGWTTVTRHGKNKAAPRTEAHEQYLTRKAKKKRQEQELLNFYRFQIKETKKEQIAQLRMKFEEDKQRIALMKQSRRFRPY